MTVREKMAALADELDLVATALRDAAADPATAVGAARQHAAHVAHQLDDLEYEIKHPTVPATVFERLI